MSNQKKCQKIAEFLVREGTNRTHVGNYIMTYKDVLAQFPNISLRWIKKNHRNIRNEIDSRVEVISETWDELDGREIIGWDMMFGLSHCPNVESLFN